MFVPDYMLDPPVPTARQESVNNLIYELEEEQRKLDDLKSKIEEQEGLVYSLKRELEEMGYSA